MTQTHRDFLMPRLQGLFFLLLLSLAGSLQAQTGLLWEISGGGTSPSYLLGTIHSDDPRVLDLPGVIVERLDGADSFSAELDLNGDNLLAGSLLMFYTDGRNLRDRLSPELYRDVVRLLGEYGIPETAAGMFKPWAAAATLSLPKPASGQFLDLWLFSRASAAGKPVYGLETMAEQVGAMEAMSEALQVQMLRMAVEQHPRLDTLVSQLIEAWLARDLSALQRISEQTLSQDARLAEAFNREVVNKRNVLMLRRMQPRLKEGNAFIAVGALHLVGEQGLLRLLEKQGYRVRAIY